jgi:hypothetical protein
MSMKLWADSHSRKSKMLKTLQLKEPVDFVKGAVSHLRVENN